MSDTDQAQMSSNDLMSYALANLHDPTKESGYAVRHGTRAIEDFGFARPSQSSDHPTSSHRNPLAAAYPVLYPYGMGGIEADRPISVSFKDHVRWSLQYYDKRFATHHSFPFVCFGISQKREAMRSAFLQMRQQILRQIHLQSQS